MKWTPWDLAEHEVLGSQGLSSGHAQGQSVL